MRFVIAVRRQALLLDGLSYELIKLAKPVIGLPHHPRPHWRHLSSSRQIHRLRSALPGKRLFHSRRRRGFHWRRSNRSRLPA